jgi:hypothetical protein
MNNVTDELRKKAYLYGQGVDRNKPIFSLIEDAYVAGYLDSILVPKVEQPTTSIEERVHTLEVRMQEIRTYLKSKYHDK